MRKQQPLGAVVVKAVGLRKGWRVIRFITGWAICWQAIEHQPTMAEYVRWASESARVSQATAYRDLELFRLVFRHEDPSILVDRSRAQIARLGMDEDAVAAQVMALPVG